MNAKDTISKTSADVIVIGAGLAGSECTYQMAKRGLKVLLIEQRPENCSEAHKTGLFAELVCSNSFKSMDPLSATGVLKSELKKLDSLILKSAEKHAIPAGQALGVNRDLFSNEITQVLEKMDNVEICRAQLKSLSDLSKTSGSLKPIVFATGPLTSPELSQELEELTGKKLYFYDAIAPIIDGSTINKDIAFLQNRRNKGTTEDSEGDYFNCPMNEEQYYAFIRALEKAEKVQAHDFEKAIYFQGCQPIEAMLERGPRTLAFGPMRPVGLQDPRTEERAFAIVQLRAEDAEGRAWSMVGFQTKLKYPEQKRIFRLIPGLEKAQFYRLGSLHRNTFLISPLLLENNCSLKKYPLYHFAGQITGVEGYLESTAIGALVGTSLAFKLLRKQNLPAPPPSTAIGALAHYVHFAKVKNYQPMNINWGLFPLDGIGERDKEKKPKLKERAERNFKNWSALLPKMTE